MTTYHIIRKAIDLTWHQGRKSVDENGNCRYRSPDGCRCAIGQIMPDDVVPNDYSIAVKGLPRKTLLACGLDPDDGEMMRQAHRLQRCHDDADGTAFRASFARSVKLYLPGYTIPDGTA